VSGRVVPYYCPYCGEEDLRPYEPEPDSDVGVQHRDTAVDANLRGGWHCHDCTRVFTLKFHGMAAPAIAAPPTGG
jgi:transposase-like protein